MYSRWKGNPAAGDTDMDPVVLLGLVGVAVWQQHPRWSREKVKRYVGELDIAALSFQGGEAVGDPPPVPGPDPASTSSAHEIVTPVVSGATRSALAMLTVIAAASPAVNEAEPAR